MLNVNVPPHDLIKVDTFNKINYLETDSYIFIGPYKQKEENSCFLCFYHHLNENDSYLKEIIDYEKNITQWLYEMKNLLSLKYKLVDTVYIIEKRTLKIQEKKVNKSPFCDHCKQDIIKKEDFSFEDSNNYRVLKKEELEHKLNKHINFLIDRDIGIGKLIFRDIESNIIPLYAIESNINNRRFFSYGRTKTLKGSKISGMLEMLERYSSMVPHFKEKIFSSYNELHEEKHNLIPFSKLNSKEIIDLDKRMYWSEVELVNSSKKFLIPQQVMYFDNQILNNENRFLYETSNGTSLGGSETEALVYAIFEALERDAFLVHWYLKKIPRYININSINNKESKKIITQLENYNYEVLLLDISLDVDLPIIWVLVRNKDTDAYLHIYNAAGAHYDPEDALFSALVEVGTSVQVYEKKLKDEKEKNKYLIQKPYSVKTMEDHVNYYSFKENSNAFEYIFDNYTDFENIDINQMVPKFEFSFQNVINHILEKHSEIYFCNMDNPILKKMNLFVSKVFIPSLQPMTFGKQNERINLNRLKNINKSENFSIRKDPHPFP